MGDLKRTPYGPRSRKGRNRTWPDSWANRKTNPRPEALEAVPDYGSGRVSTHRIDSHPARLASALSPTSQSVRHQRPHIGDLARDRAHVRASSRVPKTLQE